MLGWHQKALWCSHIFLHSFIFWIEMLYIHLYAIFSSKFGNFIHILEIFGVGLPSSSIFLCFVFKHGATSLFLMQCGYKSPKKNSLLPLAILFLAIISLGVQTKFISSQKLQSYLLRSFSIEKTLYSTHKQKSTMNL
jgi:hypothetical protein